MAKKKDAAPLAAAPAQPAAQAPAVPATMAPGSMRAAMKAAAVVAAPVKETASGPEEVRLDPKNTDDAETLVKINEFIEEVAKRDAALGRMETLDADIRPRLIDKWFSKIRAAKSFFKTLKINGLINFGNPSLKIGKPNASANPPTTKDTIADGLIAHWGDDYSKYHNETCTIKVKADETTPAAVTFLQQALDRVELTDASTAVLLSLAQEAYKKTKAPEMEAAIKELQTRQARVQGQTFAKMFEFELGIGFVTDKVGDEKVEVLKREMALNPALHEKVKEAINKGLLEMNNGSITAQKKALAVAEEKLLKEEMARQQTVAAAAAAGAAAGAMAAKSA